MPVRVSDAYGRTLDNIRLVVTDECNYKCIFCHMEGEPLEGPRKPGLGSPLLRAEDYRLIAAASRLLNVKKFKITGGEPLVRLDIIDIVKAISEGAPDSDISMTTNGYFMTKQAARLAEAGLTRVNISIHSLDDNRYKFITGVPGLSKALRGLDEAIDAGLTVKINMVVLRDVNADEVLDMADFAYKKGATLQLIELHPVGLGAKFFKKYHFPLYKIERKLIDMGATRLLRPLHNRPIYILPSGPTIEIVKPVNNPLFCAGCTRIRIGPYGDLLPCLNWRGKRPVITHYLRNKNLTDTEKILLIAETIIDLVSTRKPFYMCTIAGCSSLNTGNSVVSRIRIPKLRYYQELKKALRYQLAGEEAQQSKVRG